MVCRGSRGRPGRPTSDHPTLFVSSDVEQVFIGINRQTAETDAAGTSVGRTLSTGYDSVGNVTTSTDGLGHTTTTAYDKDNRQPTVTDPLSHTTNRILRQCCIQVEQEKKPGQMTLTRAPYHHMRRRALSAASYDTPTVIHAN